ncbi:MAG: hypothetical protein ACI4TP_00055 [Anaerotignum sp.]
MKGFFAKIIMTSMIAGLGLGSGGTPVTAEGTYLGVKDYGTLSQEKKETFEHLFDVEGETVSLKIPNTSGEYEVQNELKVGYPFELEMKGRFLMQAKEIAEETEEYTPPVQGIAGEHTLKNFLETALEPVGTTLYVYGGGWNWQDDGSSKQAVTIGLPKEWRTFFCQQDASYEFKNEEDFTKSYYPNDGFNQYYYAGADCSGYVGWAVYNTLQTESGGEGYVGSSTKMAKKLADTYGYGTFSKEISSYADFYPGDIFSMYGHVWICLGACEDGSLVILHSTPTESKSGCAGGGVQLSGVGFEGCQAQELAQAYMQKYFPEWSSRYDAVFKPYEVYVEAALEANENTGLFHWTDTTLCDPDGYRNLSAEEILQDLFGEV